MQGVYRLVVILLLHVDTVPFVLSLASSGALFADHLLLLMTPIFLSSSYRSGPWLPDRVNVILLLFK